MIGVIFATEKEAAPFLALTGQRRPRDGCPAIWGNPDGDGIFTMISGMGPASARVAAHNAIKTHGAQRLVNAGICGALRSDPPWLPGAVFAVSRARRIGSRALTPSRAVSCDDKAWYRLPSAELVTTPTPVFDAQRRLQLARWGALVDLEGAAIAAVASAAGLPCTLIKGITDFASEGGRADLQRRLARVSRRIAEVLAAGLAAPENKDMQCEP